MESIKTMTNNTITGSNNNSTTTMKDEVDEEEEVVVEEFELKDKEYYDDNNLKDDDDNNNEIILTTTRLTISEIQVASQEIATKMRAFVNDSIWIYPSRRIVVIFLMVFITYYHVLRLQIPGGIDFGIIQNITSSSSTAYSSSSSNSYYSSTKERRQKKKTKTTTTKGSSTKSKRTAIAIRTMSPMRPYVLKKIYDMSKELQLSDWGLSSLYDFWIVVDETKDNTTEQQLGKFFAKVNGKTNNITLPRIFPITESLMLDTYPKLTSYINNYPEQNVDNSTGLCCGVSIMWQILTPAFAYFMKQTGYDFGWTVEDDLGIQGHLSILQLINTLDQRLNDTVDLGGFKFRGDFWGRFKHTMNFERIVQRMENSSVHWDMYSDTLQRHSIAMSNAIYDEVSNNTYQFAERFVFPIAWSHNLTVVDVIQYMENCTTNTNDSTSSNNETTTNTTNDNNDTNDINNNNGKDDYNHYNSNTNNNDDDVLCSIHGWIDLIEKTSLNKGIEKLMETDTTPATFLFHEEKRRRQLQRHRRTSILQSIGMFLS